MAKECILNFLMWDISSPTRTGTPYLLKKRQKRDDQVLWYCKCVNEKLQKLPYICYKPTGKIPKRYMAPDQLSTAYWLSAAFRIIDQLTAAYCLSAACRSTDQLTTAYCLSASCRIIDQKIAGPWFSSARMATDPLTRGHWFSFAFRATDPLTRGHWFSFAFRAMDLLTGGHCFFCLLPSSLQLTASILVTIWPNGGLMGSIMRKAKNWFILPPFWIFMFAALFLRARPSCRQEISFPKNRFQPQVQ